MRLLIKYIESRGAGKEVSQFSFDGDVATIGRGTDQTIQISDRRLPLSHSRLTLAGGKLTLASSGDYRFAVNGESSRRAQLQAGDQVEISGHSIKVKADDGELDFVLEVEVASETVAKLRDRFQTRLRDVNVPERAIAWTLFLVILVGTLAIPMAGFYLDEREELRDSMLPDDGQWLSGELHQNHAFLGENCDACHAKPFVPTQDEDCLGCHQTITHHFDTEVHGDDYQVGSRCADCHQEHSTTGSIIRSDQGVCTTCHAKLTDVCMDGDGLLPATDFSANHPDFKVSLLQYGLDDVWHEKRVNLDEEGITEESNLIFPHDLHLDAEGIDSADGKVRLECSDCHVPEKGGMNMQAVNMQDHCASCHQLTFDPNSPDRVVPHGSPPELMRTLREYYALQYLTEELGADTGDDQTLASAIETDAEPVRAVRRPGRVARPELITDLITAMQIDPKASIGAKAAVFIEARVADAAENLFEKQTCTVCHEITAVADAEVPWKVLPVRISEAWYPLSEFSHEGHKNMECDGCHLARDSEVATDILMPDIANCRQCHGGEDAENLLASNCITCHKFHLDDQAPMGDGHGSSAMSDILKARRPISDMLKSKPMTSEQTESKGIE